MVRFASFSGVLCASLLAIQLSGASPAQPHVSASVRAERMNGKAVHTSLASYGKLPLRFEANQGQVDAHVKFLSRTQGSTLFLTADSLTLALPGSAPLNGQKQPARLQHRGQRATAHSSETSNVNLKLLGANPRVEVRGEEKLAASTNYYIGNNPQQWHTNIANYTRVKYREVYKGIDLLYYGNDSGRLEHDFVVKPGADPKQIALSISGAERIFVDATGDLVIEQPSGEVRFQKPVVYQESNGSRRLVAGRFVLGSHRELRFDLGPYDHTRDLVIDPVLTYSTYVGGSGDDEADTLAIDGAGNTYIAGQTTSPNFPGATANPAVSGANISAFVTALDKSGASILYTTYVGGADFDSASGIAVDSNGNAYITGVTASNDFPTTNPLQATYAGASDAFVTKLSASGAIVYSTYLGGTGDDQGQAIVVNSSGNIFVAGLTFSTDFPTATPMQSTNKAQLGTAFVSQLNAAGSSLIYSTYLGGSSGDSATGIALDASDNAYVTGETLSTDFPTQSAIQANNAGGFESFVAKLNAAGSALVYSTYLGGSGDEFAEGIAVDSTGDAYVTGSTDSTDFPTQNAFQSTNGGTSAYVTKINAAGSAIVYSTYLGGTTPPNGFGTTGYGIQVDAAGNAYLSGSTDSTDFPVANAVQATNSGGLDAVLAEFDPTGSALVQSTYLGGSNDEEAFGLAVDANGNAFIAGVTFSSSDFPTKSAEQTKFGGGSSDAFIGKIAATTGGTSPSISNVPAPIVAEATGTTTVVSWSAPSATDQSNASVPVVCTPTSGSGFALGTSTVDCSATDSANNVAHASFTVWVQDTTPPTISNMPADMVVQSTGGPTPAGWPAPTATDLVDGNVVVVCAPSSGSSFAVGITTVQCSAKDAANNTATASFTVTATSGAPPVSNASAVPFINQALVPTTAVPSGAAFTLKVNGTGFTSSSVVNWNGSPRTTNFVNASQVTANIPAANIAKAATAVIIVTNPGQSGSSTSNAISFPVTSPTQFVSTDRSDLFTTQRPTSVVAGDLDSDGNMDLIVANHDSSTISVYMGKGNGTFAPAVEYGAAGTPFSLAVGDLNGDGKLDIAASLDGQDSVAIFLGNGDGTLQTAALFATGSGPTGIALGDLNRDGNLDVVVTNQGGTANSVSVLLGNGDGTFQANVDYGTGAQPAWVSLGDFDKDGNLDLVVADSGTNKVSVLLGNGDGTLKSNIDYSVGSGPSSVVVADLNQDGVLDLASANTSANTISVLKGKGDGTFAAANNIALDTAPNPVTLSVADLNGDGNLDLAFTTNAYPGASVLLGNGDATFQSLSFDFITTFSAAQGLAIADFNGDGRLDLAATNPSDMTVSVLLQAPSVSLSATSLTFSGVKPGSNLARTINLANAGSAPLHISGIAIPSSPSNDFSSKDDCGTLLAGGASCTISVTFAPTKTGDQFASLTVTDDAFDSPQFVFLNATGVTGPSSTTLATSLPAWTFGQPVSLTATVSSNSGSGNPIGAVTFNDGNGWFAQAVVIGGQAVLNPTTLGSGIHTITATYQGDTNFSTSTSNSITVTVTPANSTVSAIQTSVNPSGYNQPVTFFTHVTPQFGGTATGRVNFYDGTTLLGSAGINTNNNLVVLSTSLLDAGTHQITAQYVGDTNVFSSSSPAMSQVVNQATTATGVISLQGQGTVGQSLILRATVGSQFGGTPTGTVLFKKGTAVLGTVPLVNAQADFQTNSFPFGTFTITAIYSGDANNQPSKGTTTQAVKRVATTTVVSAQTPAGFGQPLAITATITSAGGPPSDGETVTFKDGAAIIGTGTLSAGQATITTSSLSMGVHTIKALYAGDSAFIASSRAMKEKILAPTVTAVQASANPSVAGKAVKFTVKVTSPNGTPGSTVTLSVDSVVLGTRYLNAGSVSFSTSALTAGAHSITAQFNGGNKFAPSFVTVTQNVQ